jgi:signal transduction histidine kinase
MLTYIVLIVVGFGGLALFAGQQISNGLKQGFESRLEVEALLMASALHESVEGVHEGEASEKLIINQLATLAATLNVDAALLDSEGNTWFSSTEAVSQEDLSALPEVAAAVNQKVLLDLRPNEEGTPTLYAAGAVVDHDQPIAIVHLSVPAAQVQDEINSRWLTLAVGVVVMTLIALFTSLWLSRSLTQPLSRLRNSALKLAKGDFSERFREQRRDEIGELAKSLNYMADEVQAMLDEQRAFASNASHELRTPLTTIGLRTELLRSGELDEATVERYINEIDQEVGRLNGLVDDLIWLSRFEANRVTRGEELLDPVRLAKFMLRELEPKASSRQIEMKLEPSQALPPIQANRNHLHLVFRNLLDNAIKYTPDGGQVKWLLKQEDDKLHATVSDTGRGIAEEDLPHIGKRFFRTDKARTRSVGGIGLGLSLVRLVVEFYGGQLKISSPGLGQGTTVDVWWPFQQS